MCFLVYMQKNFFKKRYNFVVAKCKTTHSFSVPSIVSKISLLDTMVTSYNLQETPFTSSCQSKIRNILMWHKVFDRNEVVFLLQGSGMSSCWWCVSCMQPYWIVEIKVDFVTGGRKREKCEFCFVWQEKKLVCKVYKCTICACLWFHCWKLRLSSCSVPFVWLPSFTGFRSSKMEQLIRKFQTRKDIARSVRV